MFSGCFVTGDLHYRRLHNWHMINGFAEVPTIRNSAATFSLSQFLRDVLCTFRSNVVTITRISLLDEPYRTLKFFFNTCYCTSQAKYRKIVPLAKIVNLLFRSIV